MRLFIHRYLERWMCKYFYFKFEDDLTSLCRSTFQLTFHPPPPVYDY